MSRITTHMSVTRMAIPIVSMTQGFVVFLAFCYFACLFLAFFVLYVIFESWQHVPEPEDAEVSNLSMKYCSWTNWIVNIQITIIHFVLIFKFWYSRLKASPGTPIHFGVFCQIQEILSLLANPVVFSSNEEKIPRNIV